MERAQSETNIRVVETWNTDVKISNSAPSVIGYELNDVFPSDFPRKSGGADPTEEDDGSDTNNEPKMSCRICLNTRTELHEYISPCLCRGTVEHVHQECLETWINSRAERPVICEMCMYEYVIGKRYIKKSSSVCKWMFCRMKRGCKCAVKSLWADIVFIFGFMPLICSAATSYWIMRDYPEIYTLTLTGFINCFGLFAYIIILLHLIILLEIAWIILNIRKHYQNWKAWYANYAYTMQVLPWDYHKSTRNVPVPHAPAPTVNVP